MISRRQIWYTGSVATLLVLVFLEWQFPNMPSWGKLVSGFVSFLAFVPLPLRVLKAAISHRDQMDAIRSIQAAVESREVAQVEVGRLRWHYTYKTDTPIESAILHGQYLLDRNAARKHSARLAQEDLSQVASEEDRWKLIAVKETSAVQGVEHLQKDVRQAVRLHLLVEILRHANAPGEVIRPIREELREQLKFPWSDALFSTEVLEDVDLTPEEGHGRHYFVKYFQPLLIAFGERDFEESAGGEAGDAAHALNEHLRMLTQRRVAAAKLGPSNAEDIRARIRPKLPMEAPRRAALDKRSRTAFNRDQAAHAILIQTTQPHTEAARSIEFTLKILETYGKAKIGCMAWSPRLDENRAVYCFLWQKKKDVWHTGKIPPQA